MDTRTQNMLHHEIMRILLELAESSALSTASERRIARIIAHLIELFMESTPRSVAQKALDQMTYIIKVDKEDDAPSPALRPSSLFKTILRLLSDDDSEISLQRFVHIHVPSLLKLSNRRRLCALIRKHQKAPLKGKCLLDRRLDEVSRTLSLHSVDRALLKFAYLCHAAPSGFDAIDDSLFLNKTYLVRSPTPFLDVPRSEAIKALSPQGNLARLGLLSFNAGDRLHLDELLVDYLSGYYNDSFISLFFEREVPSTVNLDEFDLASDEIGILRGILNRTDKGSNILLHGASGAGKTSLASSLARAMGREVYRVPNNADGNTEQRLSKIKCACCYVQHRKDVVLIVDEADVVLETRHAWERHGHRTDKGYLNEFLDSSKAHIIWITNSTSGIEDSTLRRFSYSVFFEKLTNKQRANALRRLLHKAPGGRKALTDDEIRQVASSYQLAPGVLANAVDQALAVHHEGAPLRPVLESCLSRAQELILGTKPRSDLATPCPEHSVEGLRTDADLSRVMTTLARFSSYWSKSDDLPTVRNMNVLLAGPPGSGKTEFAKYIATHLGRDLLIKRASDLLSMWVGGSEKNLAEAFREAEKSKAILFIDEADSLLYGRESASRSWEVSQVNEFLCQMESLRGMLICATNHMGNFDSAAIRRFNIKINFDYLDDNGKNVFFERFFRRVLGDTPVTVDEERRLRRINNLCPGDYKVAYQKFAFLDAGDIRVTDLLGALEAEVAHKQQRLPRSVGFGIHH